MDSACDVANYYKMRVNILFLGYISPSWTTSWSWFNRGPKQAISIKLFCRSKVVISTWRVNTETLKPFYIIPTMLCKGHMLLISKQIQSQSILTISSQYVIFQKWNVTMMYRGLKDFLEVFNVLFKLHY